MVMNESKVRTRVAASMQKLSILPLSQIIKQTFQEHRNSHSISDVIEALSVASKLMDWSNAVAK
jgi:hypothetical protein